MHATLSQIDHRVPNRKKILGGHSSVLLRTLPCVALASKRPYHFLIPTYGPDSRCSMEIYFLLVIKIIKVSIVLLFSIVMYFHFIT